MSNIRLHACPHCRPVSHDRPAPSINLSRRLRDLIAVPMDQRPEPREWR